MESLDIALQPTHMNPFRRAFISIYQTGLFSGFVACASLFLALAGLPFSASAQATSTPESLYHDGATEPAEVRQQSLQWYRRGSPETQQKINALSKTSSTSVLMPVLFGVSLKDISPNFGQPRSGGRRHEGEDIIAVKGTPIVSPTPAVVVRTGTGATEGHYVYTANPGDETFVYMHLDRIGEGVVPGAVIEQGGLIGYVGDTGNAIGGAAHLHFEIHNPAGTPIDPFPRLTAEFSLQEKMTLLSAILDKSSDASALSQFLVTYFRSMFVNAQAANIILPAPISVAFSVLPAPSAPPASGTALPTGDLDVGSSGRAVAALQGYLIRAASGPAATRLASAGATGYFGSISKMALIEFQLAVGISPANGYYGSTTQLYIVDHPIVSAPIPSPAPMTTPAPSTPIPAALWRDLYKGVSGEDVRTLQKLLNAYGYEVAVSGSGSPGNETTYFGSATFSAVVKFQIASGIKPAAGYVGPITRRGLLPLKVSVL